MKQDAAIENISLKQVALARATAELQMQLDALKNIPTVTVPIRQNRKKDRIQQIASFYLNRKLNKLKHQSKKAI